VLKIQTKVAWGWLDKMLGRSRSEPGVPSYPEHMTDAQKAKVLDHTYKQLVKYLDKLVVDARNQFVKKAQQVAGKRDLDTIKLLYFLINAQNWPSVPNGLKQALFTVQEIFFHTGLPNANRSEVENLSSEQYGDALLELAVFAKGRLFPDMSDKFYAKVEKEAKKMVNVFKQPGDNVQPRAFGGLIRAFEDRFSRDAGLQGRRLFMRLLNEFQ